MGLSLISHTDVISRWITTEVILMAPSASQLVVEVTLGGTSVGTLAELDPYGPVQAAWAPDTATPKRQA